MVQFNSSCLFQLVHNFDLLLESQRASHNGCLIFTIVLPHIKISYVYNIRCSSEKIEKNVTEGLMFTNLAISRLLQLIQLQYIADWLSQFCVLCQYNACLYCTNAIFKFWSIFLDLFQPQEEGFSLSRCALVLSQDSFTSTLGKTIHY